MLSALLLAAQATAFDQVVAAERAFAAASLSQGLHESFLANLAGDAISFNPGPEPARKSHEGQGPSQGKLLWGPAWVAVSAAGDLALSTGPWQFRPPQDAPMNVTTGYFVSVWRRQKDGAWKVAVDAGTSAPVGFEIPKTVENGSARTAPGMKAGDPAAAEAAITAGERAIAAKSKAGIGAAVAEHASAAIRVYREGKTARFGSVDGPKLLTADKRMAECSTDRIVVSSSGDMGYAYGKCVLTGVSLPNRGFLHVWRKDPGGSWKILADVSP